jgi:hypothetical protein
MTAEPGTLLPDQYQLHHDLGQDLWFLFNQSFCAAVQILRPPHGSVWELDMDVDSFRVSCKLGEQHEFC